MPLVDYRPDLHERIVRDAEGVIRGRQSRRRTGVAAAGVAMLTVVVVAVVALWPESETSVQTFADGTQDSTAVDAGPAPGMWAPIARSPLLERNWPASGWTGKELLVFGGAGPTTDVCLREAEYSVCGSPDRNDGAAYNPDTNQWRPLPAPPLPEERGSSVYGPTLAGVWTGREWIVWGGTKAKGAAYRPATDSWRPIADGPLTKRTWFSMTWTGREVIVFGGGNPTESPPRLYDDGAAYNPATDRWRPIPRSGTGRFGHEALWVDGQLIVVGGTDYETGEVGTADGYDPDTNTWRQLASPPFAPSTAVADVAEPPMSYHPGRVYAFAGNKAASYDPAADRWATLADAPGQDRPITTAVWTGAEVIALRTPPMHQPSADASPAALDPKTNTWRTLPASSATSRRGGAIAWTGTELLIWGGGKSGGLNSTTLTNDGARYRPPNR
ncbi:MAG: hypothetical protein QOF60_188 [Actinomycetota bacterium]|jgi:N-acetylneuraminic acid mutarotase|nr:hypothetical protein [Actinomycetota bacterium]